MVDQLDIDDLILNSDPEFPPEPAGSPPERSSTQPSTTKSAKTKRLGLQ
jgi:hypothetical protein